MHRRVAIVVFSIDFRTSLEQHSDHVLMVISSGEMDGRPPFIICTMYLCAAPEQAPDAAGLIFLRCCQEFAVEFS